MYKYAYAAILLAYASASQASDNCATLLNESAHALAVPTGRAVGFSIPFDLIDNRIFVSVCLNGQGPFKFIFDTGAYSGERRHQFRSQNRH